MTVFMELRASDEARVQERDATNASSDGSTLYTASRRTLRVPCLSQKTMRSGSMRGSISGQLWQSLELELGARDNSMRGGST